MNISKVKSQNVKTPKTPKDKGTIRENESPANKFNVFLWDFRLYCPKTFLQVENFSTPMQEKYEIMK